ncbi:hypothetical protein DXT68_15870 [Microbacterium foliorum]|uniref:Uncharacterized protein n=1 Tax=Microbacterium foliorum TaxID=104336 RepID=A0A0F0L0K1_9MICO|nr:hypothetical protein [Microbacterium foliorum]AXL13442.1 hypothetical protein DXT68_15870 [Microbacterium foliorum]KJL25091.1 hypothetical protein RN50_00549 [Microbacterium foliorum]
MSARLDADSERELRELRARAYGPRADIATDPIALRRLEQLEASRAAIPDSGVVSVDARSASVIADGRVEDRAGDELLDRLGDDSLWDDDPDAASASAAGAADAAVGPGPAEHGAGRPARLGRKHRVLWVASVVASAAVAALVTFAVTSLQTVSTSSGAPQVDTLRLTPEGAIPPSWFGAGSDVASAEFAGLTIFETPGWTSESGDRVSDNRCLSVARTSDLPEEGEDEGDSYVGGPIYGTCGVASFPTALAVPFSDELPDELMERYPSGVAIQFVLDGDRVGVFVDSSDD